MCDRGGGESEDCSGRNARTASKAVAVVVKWCGKVTPVEGRGLEGSVDWTELGNAVRRPEVGSAGKQDRRCLTPSS